VKIVGTRTVSVVAVMVGNAALDASRIVPLNGWNIVFLFKIHVVHPIKRPAEDVMLADPMGSALDDNWLKFAPDCAQSLGVLEEVHP
jgi:hypothetical protein